MGIGFRRAAVVNGGGFEGKPKRLNKVIIRMIALANIFCVSPNEADQEIYNFR